MASLLKGVLENTDEQPEEQIDTQGEVWEGPEPRSGCTCEFGVVTLPIWKLSEVHTIEIFMEASSHGHNINSISSPSPLPENKRVWLKIPRFSSWLGIAG